MSCIITCRYPGCPNSVRCWREQALQLRSQFVVLPTSLRTRVQPVSFRASQYSTAPATAVRLVTHGQPPAATAGKSPAGAARHSRVGRHLPGSEVFAPSWSAGPARSTGGGCLKPRPRSPPGRVHDQRPRPQFTVPDVASARQMPDRMRPLLSLWALRARNLCRRDGRPPNTAPYPSPLLLTVAAAATAVVA